MEHLQPVKIARIGYMANTTKMAETLVNTGFSPLFSPERAGIRTPDNLIKSQVLYHLSYTPLLIFYIRCTESDY